MTTSVLDQTIQNWAADPDAARSAPTVTARIDDGQAAIQAGPFTFRADLPVPLGGTNQAPSPTALLLGALAGCAVVFVHDTLAPQLGVRVDSVDATVSCRADARGLVGLDGARPDLEDFTLDVQIASPDGPDAVARVAEAWQERCPIYLALMNANSIAVRFEHA